MTMFMTKVWGFHGRFGLRLPVVLRLSLAEHIV